MAFNTIITHTNITFRQHANLIMALNTNIINFFNHVKTDAPNTLNTILNIITASNQDIVSMVPFPEGISYNVVWMIQ